MNKQIVSFTFLATGFLIGATALSALAQTSTWTAPTQSPPNGNISAPILVGSSGSPISLQQRYGPLQIIGNLGVAGNFVYNPGGTITAGNVLMSQDTSGTVGWNNVTAAFPNCSSGGTGQYLSYNTSAQAWQCTAAPSGGSTGVTGIIAGSGVTASGSWSSSGTVTLGSVSDTLSGGTSGSPSVGTGGVEAVNNTQNSQTYSSYIYVFWPSQGSGITYTITASSGGGGTQTTTGTGYNMEPTGGNGPYTYTVTANPVATQTGNVAINNNGVTQITAGTNVTISPTGGTGNVTINTPNTPTPSITSTATYGKAYSNSISADPDTINCPSGEYMTSITVGPFNIDNNTLNNFTMTVSCAQVAVTSTATN